VQERIRLGVAGELPDTPKPGDPLFQRSQAVIIGDNARAAEAARQAAEERGYHSLILTTFLEGEAREIATVAVALAREVQAHGRPVPAPACLILGGETTVTLHPMGESKRGPSAQRAPGQAKGKSDSLKSEIGKGGRNQELALAAALQLRGSEGITVAALATDGSDGPTDGAGAVVDGGTVARATSVGLDAQAHLARHDAYPLLEATGDLLRGGPTNTNVNDLLFIVTE
ncbi:MAG: MOFRL family protein, partial [Ardenticatenaceae bacterium]